MRRLYNYSFVQGRVGEFGDSRMVRFKGRDIKKIFLCKRVKLGGKRKRVIKRQIHRHTEGQTYRERERERDRERERER